MYLFIAVVVFFQLKITFSAVLLFFFSRTADSAYAYSCSAAVYVIDSLKWRNRNIKINCANSQQTQLIYSVTMQHTSLYFLRSGRTGKCCLKIYRNRGVIGVYFSQIKLKIRNCYLIFSPFFVEFYKISFLILAPQKQQYCSHL